jgi:hypothetical protein
MTLQNEKKRLYLTKNSLKYPPLRGGKGEEKNNTNLSPSQRGQGEEKINKMKTIFYSTLLLLGLCSHAQEEHNFVSQKFYLHTQGELLRQHLRQNPNTNAVFQPQYVAVDSAFIAQRKEHLQQIVIDINQQKLVLWERKKEMKQLYHLQFGLLINFKILSNYVGFCFTHQLSNFCCWRLF